MGTFRFLLTLHASCDLSVCTSCVAEDEDAPKSRSSQSVRD
jgi:hypothetical protein